MARGTRAQVWVELGAERPAGVHHDDDHAQDEQRRRDHDGVDRVPVPPQRREPQQGRRDPRLR